MMCGENLTNRSKENEFQSLNSPFPVPSIGFDPRREQERITFSSRTWGARKARGRNSFKVRYINLKLQTVISENRHD